MTGAILLVVSWEFLSGVRTDSRYSKGHHSSQIHTVRVPKVTTWTKLVKPSEVEFVPPDDVVVGDHDAEAWSKSQFRPILNHSPQEDRIARQEGREARSVVLDIPRGSGQSDDDADVLTSSDVDESRESEHEIVGDGGSVG